MAKPFLCRVAVAQINSNLAYADEVVAACRNLHFRTGTRRSDSRVLLRVGKLIPVPSETSDKDLDRYTAESQSTLDRVCELPEAQCQQGGHERIPVYRREQEAKR